MAYTYEQLSEMNVAQLREIAKDVEHEAVHGFSTMHKEKLLPALCTALGIEAHKHHTAVKGFNKGSVKAEIRALKKQRDALVPKEHPKEYREILRKIHEKKNKLRRMIV
ncbi:MAG: hypothetical protein H6Q30_2911 [Bacteroidetes bacterium]|jgi:hypothetical protein|nr:hypothetical protein [Bacteroidota bacterium]